MEDLVYYSTFWVWEPVVFPATFSKLLVGLSMTKFLGGLLLAVAVALCPAYAEEWKLNAEKSKIDFVGKKTDGAHKGGFKVFKAEAKADLENPQNGSLKLEIDTDSLWSDDQKLTDHLKNPDFFDVRKFPKITFESTAIDAASEDNVQLVGKMTMLGKTVEVKVPCKATLTDGAATLTAEFKLDRTKFGMNYGKGKINDDVEVTATLVFKRP
jgi:polyisoprenoid-binding protein YceI